jgi:hypothetical protein
MKDAYVYISIRHKKADIMDGTAFITAQAATHVYEDRISWCINTDGKITPKADIHPFERQAATLVWFEPLAAAGPIGFASENGLHPARVFLKRQEYDLLIKIVAADTRQSSWKAKITPANVSTPVSIETVPLSVDEYEDVLRSYVEYYDS